MFKAKMLITYVFVSISVLSVVFGARLVNQPKMELVDVQRKEEQVSSAVGIEQSDNTTDASDSNRSTYLKYVAILQKSRMWGEIKKKILIIKPEVEEKMIEKQPETLSNKELEQLTQACYDGLKCVAIDQLIVLKTIKQPLNDGGKTTSVLTAISKICKAIIKFTTEYHEDTYQYSGVTECDDPSKVYKLINTIIEKNRVLCRIDAVSDESSKANGTKTNDPKTIVNNPNTSNNDSNHNYGTIDNYNVNKDTVNVVNINNVSSSDEAPKKSVSKPVASSASKSSKNDNQANTVQVDDNSPSANQDKSNELISNTGSQNSNATHDTSTTKINKDDKNNGQRKNTNKNSSEDSEKRVDSEVGASIDTQGSTNNTGTEKNSVSIDNPGGLGKNHADTDIASSGSSNQHTVKKGSVQNGYINNGNLKVSHKNEGVITKGKITNSKSENGTISIGTINEAPITYSNTNDNSNGKKVTVFNNQNIQQFSTTIDKIYSAMLEELSKK